MTTGKNGKINLKIFEIGTVENFGQNKKKENKFNKTNAKKNNSSTSSSTGGTTFFDW